MHGGRVAEDLVPDANKKIDENPSLSSVPDQTLKDSVINSPPELSPPVKSTGFSLFGPLKMMFINLISKLGYMKKQAPTDSAPIEPTPVDEGSVVEEGPYEFQCMNNEDSPVLVNGKQ